MNDTIYVRGLLAACTLLAICAALLAGCAGTGSLALGGLESKVETVSTAPLSVCVGVVQQAAGLLQSLHTPQPPVLP